MFSGVDTLCSCYKHCRAESETESVMSEDDGVRKEEMKKSIFMKRKSNDNSNSVSPRSPRSPRSTEEKKSPDRKSSNNYSNPFSFTHAKKATNDIIQNEILKNEIMKRKSEELNQKQKKSSEVNIIFIRTIIFICI